MFYICGNGVVQLTALILVDEADRGGLQLRVVVVVEESLGEEVGISRPEGNLQEDADYR